jgi:hypothetical protein
MKKIITIMLIALLTLTVTACSNSEIEIIIPPEDNIPQTQEKTDLTSESPGVIIALISRVRFLTLEHLMGVDLIVIGEYIEETRASFRIKYHERAEQDIAYYADAFNQLQITEVFKGNAEIGDVIPIVQQYAFDQERQAYISFDDGMTPMNKGDSWILFLRYDNFAEAYTPAGFSDGRYPLPTPAITESLSSRAFAQIETADLGVLNRSDFNFDLYAEIIDHFDIAPRDWVNPGRASDAKLIEIVQRQTSTLCAE